ncbi:MAG: FAD-binding oxidoreductase [Betaproteobacteria bacterium]|nr:FAD-binding oxidoreductase [Betaproteobacteria bacterium]
MSQPLPSGLIDQLARIVGRDHLWLDTANCAAATADIFVWPDAAVAQAVVRPASTEQLAQVMQALARHAVAVVPRGAGLSYTAGVVPSTPAVVIDCLRLKQIQVCAPDMYATVGAGTTWQELADALKPHGLRAAQISPISGSHSTVGGVASQNLPGGLEHFIGLTVVLADGTVVTTGSAAKHGASAFTRYAGPDLTGLFLGDCGAFGIKTELVVRLTVERSAAFASFQFDTHGDMLAALIQLRQREWVTRALSMDQLKADSATNVDMGEALGVAKAVLSESKSLGGALKDLTQMALGRGELKRAKWSLHLTVEAATAEMAEMQMALARGVCLVAGQEMDNMVPKAMRAKPYSIRGLVGPEGVFYSWIISTLGPYITIEPMFYWQDQLDPIHMAHLSPRNQARFSHFEMNPQARALVAQVRDQLRQVMAKHDAVHAQMGRFYPYLSGLTPGSQSLVQRIKATLDPHGAMNPGVLGLEPGGRP